MVERSQRRIIAAALLGRRITLGMVRWIDGGLLVTNGNCSGLTLVYVGQNNGDDAVRPGDLVAAVGVESRCCYQSTHAAGSFGQGRQ